jgi:hypothetical protein
MKACIISNTLRGCCVQLIAGEGCKRLEGQVGKHVECEWLGDSITVSLHKRYITRSAFSSSSSKTAEMGDSRDSMRYEVKLVLYTKDVEESGNNQDTVVGGAGLVQHSHWK